MSFYIKNKKGEYLPVEFEQVISKDWSGKLIIVKVGSDDNPANEEELMDVNDNLGNSAVINTIPDASFLITSFAMKFEILGSLDDLRQQCVVIKITGSDDLSKLGGLQKDARDKLRGKINKVAILPSPLTVDEYNEILKVKQRCDLRRSRRGR